jgi:NADH:ubiquinone oxidoreductase subunit E
MNAKVPSTLSLALARCKPISPAPPNILHSLLIVQADLGYVPAEALGIIARTLQVTDADVAGVLSFYPELHTRPMGRHQIRVCLGESCTANHSARIMETFQANLHVNPGEITKNGCFSLEKIYCVGNCAASPTVMVDEDVHGRVTPAEVGVILDRYHEQ